MLSLVSNSKLFISGFGNIGGNIGGSQGTLIGFKHFPLEHQKGRERSCTKILSQSAQYLSNKSKMKFSLRH